MNQQNPSLKMLMAGYLHQDYRVIGDVQANVDEFIADDPELAAQLPAEIVEAVTQLSESDLEQFVVRLGAQVRPPAGVTYRTWLTQIAEHVRTGQR